MLKKIIAFIIMSLILFSSFSMLVSAYTIVENKGDIDAYYLYNFETNRVMASKNLDRVISASSTVKMMSALVALESGIELNSPITVTQDMIKGINGRFMGLEVGDKLSLEDLLYCMVGASFNDATHALAISIGGSLDGFIQMMNKKAKELQMSNTVYYDATGMSSESKTSIRDILILAQRLIENEKYIKIASTKTHQLSSFATCEFNKITNRSTLMGDYKGLANLNVGSSADGGDAAVSYYDNGRVSFICIVMGAVSNDSKITDNLAEKYTKELLDHALYDNSFKTVINKKHAVTYLPVKYSLSDEKVGIYLKEDLKVYLPDDVVPEEDLDINYYLLSNELSAPLKSGDKVGVLTVSKNGKFLASADLVVNESVDRNIFLFIISSVRDFILSKYFILIFVSFVILMLSFYFYKLKLLNKMYGKYEKKKTRYINK